RRPGGLGDEFDLQFTNALYRADHEVARDDGTHAFRRAGENEIAGFEFEQPREIGNRFSDIPDHLGYTAFLTQCTVHLKSDVSLVDHTGTLDRINGPHGSAVIERLANFPGTPLLLGDALQVPTGHVQTYCVPIHACRSFFDGEVPSSLAQRHDELYLVVQIG